MKHILFPTVAAADAFIADLQSRGVVKPEIGTTTLGRRSAQDLGTAPVTTNTSTTDLGTAGEGGTPEDAGAGAVKGTVAGLVSGAAIGAIGTATGLIATTAATVATGGLALPVILGMAALGSGVGAAVGGIGGAAGVDETRDGHTTYDATSHVDDDHYDRLDSGINAGGRAVAVDENVPADVLEETMRAHDGHFV
ncbi:hypothetical protein Q0M94_19725 (plasmid) [Deinococcus radiomollis]|uniref:hypothetical protein n=1 Tax=Deinococcus radiomollis TaxID=468916 RepID=UPI003891711D